MARHKILYYVFIHTYFKNKRSEEKGIKLHKEKQQKICSRKMTVNLQQEKKQKIRGSFCVLSLLKRFNGRLAQGKAYIMKRKIF